MKGSLQRMLTRKKPKPSPQPAKTPATKRNTRGRKAGSHVTPPLEGELDGYEKKEKRKEKEKEHDLGSEALNFINYERHNLTFYQEEEIKFHAWNNIKVKSLDFSTFEPFIDMLMYQKKSEWLMWVCESVIIKCNDIVQSEAAPETHIWCGQGSPFVDFVPGVQTAGLDANKKRALVTLDDPKAKAPYDVAPYTLDRLRDFIDWKQDPDKGNIPVTCFLQL